MKDSGEGTPQGAPLSDADQPPLTAAEYRLIQQAFTQAAEMPKERRGSFLAEALGGDGRLISEVKSLLAADEEASEFIEDSAVDLLARNLAWERIGGVLGRRFGRYRCESLLGVGGMGEVYLAIDESLNRRVAIKFLSELGLGGPSLIGRLEQEALAASALNHPNIVTIHEIGKSEDTPYLVTEFIAGVTLRELLEEPLELSRIFDIAAQIAGALSAAHAEGIVHRDLKPENVMIRSDGLVKVLDFGLARLNPAAGRPGAASSQHTRGLSTAAGTLPYMSPEQIRGDRADSPTDIFSFGVLLYEMITGTLPPAHSGSQVVGPEATRPGLPMVAGPRMDIPPELASIVDSALAVDTGDRPSADELRRELTLLANRFHPAKELPPPAVRSQSRTTRFLRIAGAAVASISSLLLAWSWWNAEELGGITNRLSEATFQQLTSDPALDLFPSLTPDGRSVLFASDRSGNWDIYRKPLSGGASVNLTADCAADDRHPAVSPDGSAIAFRSERDSGGIFLINPDGGDLRRLTKEGYNPSWSPDGTRIAYTIAESLDPSERGFYPSALYTVRLADGQKRMISEGDAVQADWSPDGSFLAYWGIHKGGQRDIWTIPAGGGTPSIVIDSPSVDWNPVWSPDGSYLYFSSDRTGRMNLWRVRINARTGKAMTQPEPVTLPTESSWYVRFSRDGHRMVYVQTISRTNIAESEFDEASETVSGQSRWITRGAVRTTNPDLSPDGARMVYDSIGGKQEDLYLYERGREPHRITNDRFKDRAPRWDPGGQRILFYSDRSGRYDLWTIRPDGSGLLPMPPTTGPGAQVSAWSPDGSQILANRQYGPPDLYRWAPAAQAWERKALPEPPFPNALVWSWSPDGGALAGFGAGIFTYHFHGNRYRHFTDFGERPVWLSDNRRLLFISEGGLFILDTATGAVRRINSVEPYQYQSLGIANDRRRIYFSLQSNEADLWMASLPPPSREIP